MVCSLSAAPPTRVGWSLVISDQTSPRAQLNRHPSGAGALRKSEVAGSGAPLRLSGSGLRCFARARAVSATVRGTPLPPGAGP